MVRTRLCEAAQRIATLFREEFGRPAINRRILHRLATTDEAELALLGLTRADVREAAGAGIADAASFLRERRTARFEGARAWALRRDERIQFE